MYCCYDMGKRIEIVGRGLSLGDAYDTFGFDFCGTIPVNVESIYREGTLRFRIDAGEAIPVIQYADEEETLCCAFQRKGPTGEWVDYDVYALARSLTYVLRRRT